MDQTPRFDGRYEDYRASPVAVEQTNDSNRIELALAAAAVFLAPVNILRTDAFYLTASDVFATVALLALVMNRTLTFASLGAGTFLWNTGLVLMAGMLFASSLVFGDPTRGVVLSGQYLFAYLLMSHVLLSRTLRETVFLLRVFVASVTLMCVHGIYAVDISLERYTAFVSGSGRLQGFVERENECAALIALTVPLALWLAVTGNMKPVWLLLIIPLFAYAIMLTGSNTGLFGLLYAVAASVLVSGSWRQIWFSTGAVAVLYGAVLTWGTVFLPIVFQRRVLGALETGSIDQAGTFTGRFELVLDALSMTKNSMFLGVGADQYREISDYGAPVHNMYLLVWVEAGFLGMIGFGLMMVGALVTAAMAFRVPGHRPAAACTFTSVTLFALLVNATPHVYGRFLVVSLLLGLAPSIMATQIQTDRLASPGARR
ncbi:hypothetical protein Sa4125_05040 [Aureimonas sp. SA4125]|uniref:O-antigen ligase family protein n=1 Tax=Aureimonas sp. SA4125 TaxID=2826993 RepID=UPI001CC3B179|nr:O-antigen ligase family protein [Aureimonas sp. SA4125]BDA82962.1 hypothetical protein Sa4125_05040 [Aureimonas sp. SA4125]